MNLGKTLAAAIAGIVVGYFLFRQESTPLPTPENSTLNLKIKELEKNLLGHTAYETYLTAANSTIESQAKIITAKIIRQERVLQVVDKNLVPWVETRAVVEISYQAEYSFGFDLRPKKYSLKKSKSGNELEILVNSPMLVATPAVNRLAYRTLSNQPFSDPDKAMLKLFQRAPIWANDAGKKMTATPEVRALCEKELISFVRSFLLKQKDVQSVPNIRITYLK